ncbi:unnamed protein product [Symbiodinium natans]|uniref:Vms1-associating treble clef domain-containing protein n=1 Tax=Symbiodinium natans TaxID=878477 RepID=A0A812KJ93_9DINO|nr:unnamed protein product [Symbiodinium natans]
MDPNALVVMTLAGPVPADALNGPILCREWLLNDQSTLLQSSKAPLDAGDVVQLSCLSSVRRWPLSTLHNLHLNREDAVQAAAAFSREFSGAGLILVSTPSSFSVQQPRALLEISREAGVQIAMGTTPPQDLMDFEACVSAVVSDLACGFSGSASTEPLRPGFIGEIDAEKMEILAVCVEAQLRSQAPLLVVGSVPREALGYLDRGLWRKCAFFDVPDDSPVSVQELQERGAYVGFCAPPQAADVAWEDYPGRRPMRSEAGFLEAAARVRPGQLLASTGLRFRCDLAAFGGPGLGYAPQLLQRGSLQHQCWANAASFLSYPWQPPKPPEKVLHEIECHWCGTMKPDGEHFSKMGFDYCSPSCVAKHRKADFEASAHGVENLARLSSKCMCGSQRAPHTPGSQISLPCVYVCTWFKPSS